MSHHLTLKHFILRHQVLSLYRSAIHASRSIPDKSARKETIAWIRAEFERNRHTQHLKLIEAQLSSGRREIRQFFPAVPPRSRKP